MNVVENKVVWVTGSSSGIGKALACGFADHGADVIVHGHHNIQGAQEVVDEIRRKGRKAFLVKGDVTNRSEVQEMVSQIKAEFGRVDIVINNAGTMVKRSQTENLDDATWDQIMDINLKSVFIVTQEALPLMKTQEKGQIVNMTSLAARNGGGGGAVAYATAKGGVSTFTRGLAKELAEYNIRVNGIGPGVISTPFHDRYSTNEMRQKMARQVPLGREGTPEEVVGAALYLASDYASYVTGEIIEVNGGMLMD